MTTDDHGSNRSLEKQSTRDEEADRKSEITIDGEVYKPSPGVQAIENLAKATQVDASGRRTWYMIGVCMFVLAFARDMEAGSVGSYSVFATSTLKRHAAGISATGIATSIITAVIGPFIAKLSDIFGRMSMYGLVLAFYTFGFVALAACNTISSFIFGKVFIAVGEKGLSLMQSILCADLVPIQWRGVASGILSTPYLVTTWFMAIIVAQLSEGEKWRWGYGMWAIVIPVILIPAIAMLLWLERRAKKQGLVERIPDQEDGSKRTMWEGFKWVLIEVDAFGLILLAFGFALLLLPFSLATNADGHWSNRSLIAMLVVGFVILNFYCYYEWKIAPRPSFPKRFLKNRTFMMAIIIDFIYMVVGYLHLGYFESYIIVTDLDTQHWNYVCNAETMGLCSFGLLAGVIMRYTHRYKAMQVFGLALKIAVVIGAGGAFSVVGTGVAVQASVPHQDVGLAIAMLSLWSSIGRAIGFAISGTVWGALMPGYLRETMAPLGVSAAQAAKYYGSIAALKAVPFNDPVRQAGIEAYKRCIWKLWGPTIGLSFIPFIAAFFQSNYYLGEQQNNVTNTTIAGEKVEVPLHPRFTAHPKTLKERLWNIWAA